MLFFENHAKRRQAQKMIVKPIHAKPYKKSINFFWSFFKCKSKNVSILSKFENKIKSRSTDKLEVGGLTAI